MSLLQTIESDLGAAGNWLVGEVEGVATEVWGVVKGIFTSAAPGIVNNVVSQLKTYLPTQAAAIASGTPLETIEQNFVMWAYKEGVMVLGDLEQLGSTMVQGLIALTIKSLPKT